MSKRECFTPKWPRFTPGQYTFSPAVKKGKILALSGIGSTDSTGELLYPGDVVRQTKQIFENMKEILAAAGASFDDVIKTVDYITPAAVPMYRETAAVRREYFKDGFPAATGIVVNGLLRKGMVIEIDALAVLD